MKLKIGNKKFNNVIIGINKLSPYITCKINTIGDYQIVIHFFVKAFGKNFFSHHLIYEISIINNKFDITTFNIDVECLYKNLKNSLEGQFLNSEEREIIINSIIDKKVQILL